MTENKGDLISREALKDATNKLYNETLDGIVKFGIEKVYDLISNAPTVEIPVARWDAYCEGQKIGYEKGIKERPQGEWIFNGFCFSSTQYKCNKCDYPTLEKTNYCSNCGADMRG